MAGFTIPNDVSAGTAEQHAQASPDSVDFTILAAAENQTGVLSGCAVTAQGTPNMTVAVAVGVVQVAGPTVPVTAGNGTITTANATNPRFDLVTINSSGTITVVAGTAAATPVFPTTSNVVLAAVYVGANVTSITSSDIVDKRMLLASPSYGWGVYGDGSDGTVTFDGTTTVLGLAPSSNVYTLTRDLFLATATINSGVTLNPNGHMIFVRDILTNNGSIAFNGTSASGTTGAAGAGSGTLASVNLLSTGGRNGGTTAGQSGNNSGTPSLGGNSGSSGSSGANGAGSAGSAAGPTLSSTTPPRMVLLGAMGRFANAAATLSSPGGGAGGAGGAGDGTNAGGGGGAGGGVVILAARIITGTGTIQARGGAGFSPTVGNTGGGGGGGGGGVIVVSGSVNGGAITGQTIDSNSGAGGTGHGTGNDGNAGSNGSVILIPN